MYSNILFFDSECLLCNSFIKWVTRCDKRNSIRFSRFNSKIALELQLSIKEDTLIYYSNGIKHYRTQAIIEIMKELKTPILIIGLIKIFPISLRDFIYHFIAKNRYKLGRMDSTQSCSLEVQSKIIE